MDKYANELEELAVMYQRAGTEAQKLTAPLLNEAIFQQEELKKLRESISKNGWTSHYQHGAYQHGTTQSAEAKTYLALTKAFNGTIKTLYSVLDNKMPEPEDDFTKFTKKETR